MRKKKQKRYGLAVLLQKTSRHTPLKKTGSKSRLDAQVFFLFLVERHGGHGPSILVSITLATGAHKLILKSQLRVTKDVALVKLYQ